MRVYLYVNTHIYVYFNSQVVFNLTLFSCVFFLRLSLLTIFLYQLSLGSKCYKQKSIS